MAMLRAGAIGFAWSLARIWGSRFLHIKFTGAEGKLIRCHGAKSAQDSSITLGGDAYVAARTLLLHGRHNVWITQCMKTIFGRSQISRLVTRKPLRENIDVTQPPLLARHPHIRNTITITITITTTITTYFTTTTTTHPYATSGLTG
ncbi:hypothetical protein LZ30DRAFT_48130 [Colletotrichum cereale]|nr:hypothetical protein LZ30DRAFT_48130 [Colletotrichum cereale]